ncbi:MAG: universal stress protein [Ilumatobacter sp.]|uniref:universal stress protein n=1 Tax=Ilumatobacter sp. TaxID=1967498 RepID=UPI003C7483A9
MPEPSSLQTAAAVSKPLNVVIPLDGSRHADRGITPGKRIGAALHLGIGVMTVASHPVDLDESMLDEAVADEHLDWSATSLSTRVPDAIVEVAREHDAMVCMATHGHGRSVGLIGSIPEDVVRQSTMPVLFVGPAADVYEDQPIRELVVAISGDEPGERVCEAAVDWAVGYGLRLRFVIVVQPTPEPFDPSTPSDRWFGPDGDEHAYMTDLVRRFEAPGLDLDGVVVYDPVSPAGGLAQMMRARSDAILIVGTHSRTGMSRLVHGSVASNIVAEAPTPVLMFPFHRSGPGRRVVDRPHHRGHDHAGTMTRPDRSPSG